MIISLVNCLALCPDRSSPCLKRTEWASELAGAPGRAAMPAEKTSIFSVSFNRCRILEANPSAIGLRQVLPVQTNNRRTIPSPSLEKHSNPDTHQHQPTGHFSPSTYLVVQPSSQQKPYGRHQGSGYSQNH